MKRRNNGSIVTFLMILGIIGFTLVIGLLGTELLIRWVSLSRVQNAAREAVVVYARDMIRLRDNALSVARKSQLSFAESGVAQDCSMGGCTPPIGAAAAVPGATSMEYLNASRTFLYNIWHKRLEDPAQVDDVRQFQCYKAYDDMRFAKIESSAPTCSATGKVSSPITGLSWSFTTNPYGTGVCCASGSANDTNKDFCVQMRVRGRMDPVIAGGLPFLSQKGVFSEGATASNGRERMPAVNFITVGDFDISVRAVANKMSAAEGTGDGGNASNLSGETIYLEDFNGGASCAAAPPVSALVATNPIPRSAGLVSPPNVPELPPDESVPRNLTPPSVVPPVPSCPGGYQVSGVISIGSGGVSFSCSRIPPTPPQPPARPPTPSTPNNITPPSPPIPPPQPAPTPPPPQPNTSTSPCPNGGYLDRTSGCVSPNVNCQNLIGAVLKGGDQDQLVQTFPPFNQLPKPVEDGSAQLILTQSQLKGKLTLSKKGLCSPQCGCFCVQGSGSCVISFGFNSPLVISLNGSKPEISERIIEFSYDGESRVRTYWIGNGASIGFIFADLNNNQIADDGTELFGPNFEGGKGLTEYVREEIAEKIKVIEERYRDGYDAVSSFSDANGDGRISGEEIKGLKVWFDKNGNGVCELTEVQSLDSLGVTSLETRVGLVKAKSWFGNNGFAKPWNERGYEGVDGISGSTYDIWFKQVP
jgi:hypothetical protein